MITYRVLPPEEWDKLQTIPFGQGAAPNPEGAILVVAEDQGEIIGIWGAGSVVMLDGLWVKEDRRDVGTGVRLFQAMMVALNAAGVPQAFTFTEDPHVHQLATRLGFQDVPGTFMMIYPPTVKELT